MPRTQAREVYERLVLALLLSHVASCDPEVIARARKAWEHARAALSEQQAHHLTAEVSREVRLLFFGDQDAADLEQMPQRMAPTKML